MPFRVLGIDPGQFSYLYELSDADLAAEGAKRYVVDSKPGFPNRVEVRDMNIGEHAILLNYEYQPADTPYRSRHAIFVREGAHRALDAIDVIPDVLRVCPISLRGFSENGEMVDANLVDGDALAPLIEQFFENPAIAYLQAHYAKRGCYAARIVPFRNDRQDGQDIPYWDRDLGIRL
ncbi:MAG: DUF1203 domain-containing protein [Sphingomonas sp.]|nr:MAG: DUF1203 domain-containing protein [Sphingomonas sp.]